MNMKSNFLKYLVWILAILLCKTTYFYSDDSKFNDAHYDGNIGTPRLGIKG